tara:strand:+ start:2447 stop:2896 length:450 start_codon:yes stop_codon:yes gene_type:complete
MKAINLLIKILLINVFFITLANSAKNEFFKEGKILFDKKEFKKSKFFFEKDIVYNPKSENSYLYLAKIFSENGNEDEQEINLNNVLLLNPQNDEAIYMLIILKIKQSDYNKSKELIEKFNLVCKSFCSKKNEINNKFNKLIPENEKDNN